MAAALLPAAACNTAPAALHAAGTQRPAASGLSRQAGWRQLAHAQAGTEAHPIRCASAVPFAETKVGESTGTHDRLCGHGRGHRQRTRSVAVHHVRRSIRGGPSCVAQSKRRCTPGFAADHTRRICGRVFSGSSQLAPAALGPVPLLSSHAVPAAPATRGSRTSSGRSANVFI